MALLFLLLQLLCYSPCQEVLTYHIRWSTYLLLATLYQDQGLDLCRLELTNPCCKVICVIKVSFQQQSLVLYLLTVHTLGRLSEHSGDNNRSVKKANTITRIMSHRRLMTCQWSLVQMGFSGFFVATWFWWSGIINPDPTNPKGTDFFGEYTKNNSCSSSFSTFLFRYCNSTTWNLLVDILPRTQTLRRFQTWMCSLRIQLLESSPAFDNLSMLE